jgi:hypothetical protein
LLAQFEVIELTRDTMTIFGSKREPPTAIDLAAVADAGNVDSEKQDAVEFEGDIPHGLHIDPELERRVVRKLDLRLVPLVMSLCE